jgi:hypothetical protein
MHTLSIYLSLFPSLSPSHDPAAAVSTHLAGAEVAERRAGLCTLFPDNRPVIGQPRPIPPSLPTPDPHPHPPCFFTHPCIHTQALEPLKLVEANCACNSCTAVRLLELLCECARARVRARVRVRVRVVMCAAARPLVLLQRPTPRTSQRPEAGPWPRAVSAVRFRPSRSATGSPQLSVSPQAALSPP